MNSITNKLSKISVNVDQGFYWYNSSAGNNINSIQTSGAYVFRFAYKLTIWVSKLCTVLEPLYSKSWTMQSALISEIIIIILWCFHVKLSNNIIVHNSLFYIFKGEKFHKTVKKKISHFVGPVVQNQSVKFAKFKLSFLPQKFPSIR